MPDQQHPAFSLAFLRSAWSGVRAWLDDQPIGDRIRANAVPLGLLAWAIVVVAALGGMALSSAMRGDTNSGPTGPASSDASQLVSDAEITGPGAHLEDFTVATESLLDLSAEAARAWNAALPVSTSPIQAARPFFVAADDWQSYSRALDCLTAAVHFEAANEPAEGQAAVAQVVVNRMRHPAYPNTICGVVFQGSERTTGCQFSFTCDGSLARAPSPEAWARARRVAAAALNGYVARTVGMATHYHADYVAPNWAPRLTKLGQIGLHIFYRWPGDQGMPAAFTRTYDPLEPILPGMDAILGAHSLMVETETAVSLTPAIELLEVHDGPDRTLEGSSAGEDLVPLSEQRPILIGEPEPTVLAQAAPPPQAPPLQDPLARPSEPARSRRIAVPGGW